jgi:F-type H+-transporting ATPase subunit b
MATGETQSGHTTAEGGKPPFPPFEKDTFASQLVFLLIAFVALYLIVSRIALPRVDSVIDARRNAIDNDLGEAQRLKDKADDAIKAYERELADARARAQAIGGETRQRLNAQTESERKTLEGKLAAKLAEAETSIAAARRTAMGNVKTIAAEAAAALVQQLSGQTPDSRAVEAAVQDSLKG